MAFIRVDHNISDADGLVLSDAHDIVYRAAAQPGERQSPPPPPPANPEWVWRIDPDPVLLFRYSALTFNSYRIHYDRLYAIENEGYPGLVVRSPLTATLLLHGCWQVVRGSMSPPIVLARCGPLFDTLPFHVCGSVDADSTARLFARDERGALGINAIATLHQPI